VTSAAGHCSFCGASRGPFATVEGLVTVLICVPCLEVRQAQPDRRLGLHDPGPYPPMTPAATDRSVRGQVGQPTAAPAAAGWPARGCQVDVDVAEADIGR
jgi:hypothetical protein